MSAALRLCALLLLALTGGSAADEPGEWLWPVDPDVRVDVEIISGAIEIEGWDRDEVRLRAQGEGRAGLDAEVSRERVSVRAGGRPERWFPWPGGVDVELRLSVPGRSRVQARIINGPIVGKDLLGAVSFQAANGEIDVRGAPSEAHLETMNSSIKFEGRGSRVEARAINGDLDLRGVSEKVVASTMRGSIQVEAETLEHADLRTLSGSIVLETALAPRARVRLKSYSGSIELLLPGDTSAHFDVQSFSGQVQSALGPAQRLRSRPGLGQRVDFDAGEGAGRVTIDTFSGEVKIEATD